MDSDKLNLFLLGLDDRRVEFSHTYDRVICKTIGLEALGFRSRYRVMVVFLEELCAVEMLIRQEQFHFLFARAF